VGDPLGLGSTLEAGRAGSPGCGDVGSGDGAYGVDEVGSACWTGRSAGGGCAGAVTPGSETPTITLTPTATTQATTRNVMLRSTSDAAQARSPRWSAKT
jgi:hypothetical protein